MTTERITRYRQAQQERYEAERTVEWMRLAEDAAWRAMSTEEQDQYKRELAAQASAEGSR